MLTPEQCRAARALLDWSQGDLADQAGVGIVTVRQLEAGAHDPRRATLNVIRRALESAGVEFLDENGELKPRFQPAPMMSSFMQEPGASQSHPLPVPKGPVEVW